MISINLDGFEEAFQFGTKEAIIGEEKYKTCTIPGIVMLKMIAFDERPDQRIKDVKDINSICNNYASIEQNYIWAAHFDLYDDNLGNDEIAMIVLGREIRKLVITNSQLYKRLLGIFQKIINQRTQFLFLMIEDTENETIEMKQRLMTFIRKGFTEKIDK